ncbi:MAG: hypothetical protein R2710_08895 [Acidimicrobiales bacterium]
MELLIQRLFDGLYNGAIYAALALALVAIYRSTNLLNFAQGEMAMPGLHHARPRVAADRDRSVGRRRRHALASYLPGHPWPAWAAVIGAVVFGAVLGIVIEFVCIRPIQNRSDLTKINVTIGLLVLLNGITVAIWKTNSRAGQSISGRRRRSVHRRRRPASQQPGGMGRPVGRGAPARIAAAQTKAGLAFRAITSNPASAQLVGVSVGRTTALGWGWPRGSGRWPPR